MDLIFGALKNFSTGNRAMYSGTNLTPYEMQKNLHGVMRLGGRGGCWITFRFALRTIQPACWGGMGFAHKNGHIVGGGELVVRSFFFLIPYFPYYVYDTYSKGSQEGIYFPFSKNCLFNLGVCFFSRIWRVSTFNFCVVFVFSEIYLPFSFFFCFFNCFVFFQIFKN